MGQQFILPFLILKKMLENMAAYNVLAEEVGYLLKVMLVDDMDVVRLELKRMHVWGEKSGFAVVDEAKNGEEALEKLQRNKIDLVITDIKMPKIDGMELLSKIVTQNLCPCVVLLSDFSEFSYARQGLILGAFDFLAKPANAEELEKLLERAHEHIVSKQRETERVKKLEEVFKEKTEEFFHEADIDEIAELIQSRDSKAAEKIRHIMERIGAGLDYDTMKVEGVMKKGVPQVIEAILDTNGWFEKYIDIAELGIVNIHRFDDFDEILDFIMKDVGRIIAVFNTLQLGYPEKGIVWEVCNYVLRNIDNGLSLQTVSENLYVNRTYISEVFRQKTGLSFIEYLTRVKIERGKQLMGKGLKSYEAAETLGFKDAEYFGKLFKKHTGKSLSEFRHKK